jgi:hypothetical protein
MFIEVLPLLKVMLQDLFFFGQHILVPHHLSAAASIGKSARLIRDDFPILFKKKGHPSKARARDILWFSFFNQFSQ